MNNLPLSSKLELIFNKLKINDKLVPYWKIGTDISKILDNLLFRLKNIDDKNPLNVIVKKNKYSDKERFWIIENETQQIITPIKENKIKSFNEGVGNRTVIQYFSIFKTFDLFEKENVLKANVKNLLSNQNRYKLIINGIQKTLNEDNEDTKKVVYSLLLEILFFYKFDFKKLNLENRFCFLERGEQKEFDLTDDNDKHKLINNVYYQGSKCYRQMINEILAINDNLENILDDILKGSK